MTDSQMPVDPAGALSDPATSAEALRLIAYYHPELRRSVVAHPNAYEGLIDWLDSLGDPGLSEVIAAHRAQAAAPAEPTAPLQSEATVETADAPIVTIEEPIAAGEPESAEVPADFIDGVPGFSDAVEIPAEITVPVELGTVPEAVAPVEAVDGDSALEETVVGPAPTEVLPAAVDAAPAAEFAETAVPETMPEVEPAQAPVAPFGEPVVRNSIFPAAAPEPRTAPTEGPVPATPSTMGRAPMPGQGAWTPSAPAPATSVPSAPWAGPTPGMGAPVPGAVQAAPTQSAAPQWPHPQAQPQPNGSSNPGLRIALIVLSVIALVLLGIAAWTFTNGFGTQNAHNAGPRTPAPATDQAPSAPSQSVEPAPPSEKPESFPAPASARTMRSFAAPSDNIHCVLSEDSVQCQIYETNWAGTQYDTCGHSGGVLRADGNGSKNVCAIGDSGVVEGTLDYGSFAKYGHSACQSTQDGISCWNTATGYSFALARQGWMTGSTGLIEPQDYTF